MILEQLHKDWDLLLSKLAEKGVKLQQALVLVQFLRQCDEVMFWINDKVNIKLNIFNMFVNYLLCCIGNICHY